ncbi:CDP-Glycerol:Poly(glycerophosphate) glycerophosphotransferase [Brevibacterium sandarakinum]|uniref:CDP-Glycerol:Poly(Glycerophosphate) glycerophosphotransferase n=1 Tax=Brevibacterium sandarakinum TaxID=629680 RepID=A0A1H1V0S0_BRESA|nr:CDP-glycerol glycerophosphotransferase family protein [Brevibacterium sandarakinum]SDS78362.1 CDP-Glycerol:Poly(glycerophosphate) glycerophosphotransferase [Brevibacterium sandarakinum]
MVSVADTLELSSKIVRKLNTSVSTVRRRSQLRALARFRPVPDHQVDVLLNFPGEPVNLYQVRQWYGPLEHLAKTHSVAILCYQPATAEIISQETDLKVILTPSYTDLREVENDVRPKVILYPNQNYANYRILGITSAEHVFICHGESDKIYMASNWVKVFNYFFVAGEASRERLRKHVRNYDVDGRTIAIGRPQIDIEYASPLEKRSDRITVLYAPTWEGGRLTMRYGSVASHGVAIVSALLSDERFRVIYRPHPRTGIHEPEFAAANEQIKGLITVANERSGGPHYIDDTPFGWQLDVADVMITDISAVAYDWLTTAKPLLVTRPFEPEAVMPHEGFMSETPLLAASDAHDSVRIIDAFLGNEGAREAIASWADYYYGDRSPGRSLDRFVAAVDYVIDERDQATGHDSRATDGLEERVSSEGRGNTRPQRSALKQKAAQGLTFAYRSIDFATTGVANLVAQYRGEAHSIDLEDSAMKLRSTDVLVSTMAGPHDIDPLIDWLPTLERLSRHYSLTLLAGNQRAFDRLRDSTVLRVHIGRSASETEKIFANLKPNLHLQFEQANLNLRELTHRNVTHAYIGTDQNDSWINNRLRAFDAVIGGTNTCPESVRSALIDFPPATAVTTVSQEGDLEQSRATVITALLQDQNARQRLSTGTGFADEQQISQDHKALGARPTN